jgi:hypothetical protein
MREQNKAPYVMTGMAYMVPRGGKIEKSAQEFCKNLHSITR